MGGICSDHTRSQLKAFPPALSLDNTEESETQVSTLSDKRGRKRSNRTNRNVVSNKLQPSVLPDKDLLVMVKSESSPVLGKRVLSQPIIREAQMNEDKKSSTSAAPTPALERKGERNEDVQPSKEPLTCIKGERNEDVQPSKEPSTCRNGERNEDVQQSKEPLTNLQFKSTQSYTNTLFEIMNRDKTPTTKIPASREIPAIFTQKHRRNTYGGPTSSVKRKRKLTFESDEGRKATSETCIMQQSETRSKQQEARSEELPDMEMNRSLRKRVQAISDNDRDTLRLSTCF